jgi:putative acetyltransferase
VSLHVRDETEQDAAAVAATISAAFGDHDVAPLWADVRAEGLVHASLVAELDGEVVGHVGVSAAWLDARERLVDLWMLSPLSVVPDRQGEGIGTALLAAAVERARTTPGVPMLVLEGSPRYYGARGFDRAADHRVYPPSARTPDRAFQVVLLEGHEPWMTGQCVYRDVWWRHDAAGLRGERLDDLEAALGVADPRPR